MWMCLFLFCLLTFGCHVASDDPNIFVPRALEQIDEVVSTYLSALLICGDDMASEQAQNFNSSAFGTPDHGSSETGEPPFCFWECVLTNMDMMKDGNLEYLLPEGNEILKNAFDICSKKAFVRYLDSCPLAHLFLLCEYNIFLQNVMLIFTEMGAEVFQVVNTTAAILAELNKKLVYLTDVFSRK